MRSNKPTYGKMYRKNHLIMDDNSLMTFGIHKGKKLANVPADYLLWLYNEKKCYGPLKDYIQENIDVLKQEVKTKNNANKDTKKAC